MDQAEEKKASPKIEEEKKQEIAKLEGLDAAYNEMMENANPDF